MTESQGTRNQRRVITGVVSSDKMAKTITVTIEHTYKHPKYQKFVKKHTKVYAHDETEDAHEGDTVELIECRPMSKQKRWRLGRVVTRSVMPSGGDL